MLPPSHHLTENSMDSPVLTVAPLEVPLFFSLGVPVGCRVGGLQCADFCCSRVRIFLGLSPAQEVLRRPSAWSWH